MQVYRDYEDATYVRLMALIDARHGTLPREIFIDFAQKIFKRNK